MYFFTFVILHYIVIDDTVECIDSILENTNYEKYKIVVVDNGSPNGTGKILFERYRNNNKVIVTLNNENIGFSKGNNIGYRLAKYQLKSDFIMLLNNDTIIKQKDFVEKIINKYNNERFDILGPDIISLSDNGHQNPQRTQGMSLKELKKNIYYLRIFLISNYLSIETLTTKLLGIRSKLKSKIYKIRNTEEKHFEKKIYEYEQKNIQLHGSCLIFSPQYVNRYDGLYEETFMFLEEDILFFMAKKYKLITLYTPEIYIYHKEDSSTDAISNKNYLKRRFIYKYTLESSKVLLSLMKK
ncbi:glycosyltransferase family 2 protein [Paenibacillus sp. 7124]|uniref:Glycosyltransferase family 2 protein n=1 Tax=Paenibacillus apii TaxID=1850370 RepID=A0A6M1PP40_9BACL|nr:glycosyltransferase [Paenibacillus apii]NGM83573.1 glycosyltransferase family 2 protein [Paenibacillus apii]